MSLYVGEVLFMMSNQSFEKKQILFVFLSRGEKVSFANDNIVIKTAEGKVRHRSTCYRIFLLFLIGHITVTSGLIQKAHRFNFRIILMKHSLQTLEVLGHRTEGNVMLRKLQYTKDRPDLANRIVWNKILNQRCVLNIQRKKTEEVKNAISALDRYLEQLDKRQYPLRELLGIEGSAARTYFPAHFQQIDWQGRKPRIKQDYVNATLDIGYTILFHWIDALLNLYGFDVYCGILHRQFYQRKSLVCDLVEPFRPLIDHQLKKSIHLFQCKPEDFSVVNHQYLLKWEKNADYIKFLCKPLLEHKEEMFLYIQGYYRCLIKGKPAEEFPVYRIGGTE